MREPSNRTWPMISASERFRYFLPYMVFISRQMSHGIMQKLSKEKLTRT